MRHPPQQASLGTTPFDEEEEDVNDDTPSFLGRHKKNKKQARAYHTGMSLDRSPSPQRGGGWASPGLTTPLEEGSTGRSRGASPNKRYGELNGGRGVTWANAKASSARVNGYPSYQSRNQGFFGRHMRRISSSLPYFSHGGEEDRIAEKEKAGRGRSGRSTWQELPRRFGMLMSRRRKYVGLAIAVIFALLMWFHKRERFPEHRSKGLADS